jgi:hypothetical protein
VYALTETEQIILQVAQPNLQRDPLWNVDPSLVSLAQVGEPPVHFEFDPGHEWWRYWEAPDSVDSLQFQGESFQKVAYIGEYTLEAAASTLPCVDSIVEYRYPEVLGEIAGGGNINSCIEIDRRLCGKMSSTRLRALCPQTCACYDGILSWSGLFGTSAFGCPTECLKHSQATFNRLVGDWFPCEDTGPGNFSAVTEYLPGVYQYWNFQFSQLLVEMGIDTFGHRYFRDFYQDYVSGLQEYVSGDPSMRQGVPNSIYNLQSWRPDVPWPEVDALIGHILDGVFFEELAAGNWTIFPGVPHPRGFTGCAYLASAEIAFLINVDLCAVGNKIASIRPWCPRACGCSSGMPECPGSCR